MLRLTRQLLRMISHSAEWMNPMPPMSAASWYTSSKGLPSLVRTAASQLAASRRSTLWKSWAAVGENSVCFWSAPRTQ